MKLTLVFTDVDGTRYYKNGNGDIVRKDGSLVTTTEETNVRAMIQEPHHYETIS